MGSVRGACQPYRAQTKGKVESDIRYVRGNFWPGLEFVDLSDLNQQGWDWLDVTANVRIHGTTGAVPLQRLPLEHLQSIADKPDYDTSLFVVRPFRKRLLRQLCGQLLLGACSVRLPQLETERHRSWRAADLQCPGQRNCPSPGTGWPQPAQRRHRPLCRHCQRFSIRYPSAGAASAPRRRFDHATCWSPGRRPAFGMV